MCGVSFAPFQFLDLFPDYAFGDRGKGRLEALNHFLGDGRSKLFDRLMDKLVDVRADGITYGILEGAAGSGRGIIRKWDRGRLGWLPDFNMAGLGPDGVK